MFFKVQHLASAVEGKCATFGIPYSLLMKLRTMVTRIMVTVGDIGVPREAGIILKKIYYIYMYKI